MSALNTSIIINRALVFGTPVGATCLECWLANTDEPAIWTLIDTDSSIESEVSHYCQQHADSIRPALVTL